MASERERFKANGASADELKQRMQDLQAQLDALQKERDESAGQLAAGKKAAALARQQLRSLQGGKLISLNGCRCAARYQYKGKASTLTPPLVALIILAATFSLANSSVQSSPHFIMRAA